MSGIDPLTAKYLLPEELAQEFRHDEDPIVSLLAQRLLEQIDLTKKHQESARKSWLQLKWEKDLRRGVPLLECLR